MVTLEELSALIKLLLIKGFKYVLPSTCQSERFDGEFGVYSQSAGGGYYISLQQIMNSLFGKNMKSNLNLHTSMIIAVNL